MTEPSSPLPTIATTLEPREILARLLHLSKRGKFAGFVPCSDGPLFEAEAHGTTFDFRLVATHHAGQIRFELRPVWKLPIILASVTILAAGPGLWLTHSMMVTYFSWYTISLAWTAAWYEPLTILPIPWIMLRAWKTSKLAAVEHARGAIARIALTLQAQAPSGGGS
jgi:hypothetical protein